MKYPLTMFVVFETTPDSIFELRWNLDLIETLVYDELWKNTPILF